MLFVSTMKSRFILILALVTFVVLLESCYPDVAYQDGQLKATLQPICLGSHGCDTSRNLFMKQCMNFAFNCFQENIVDALLYCMVAGDSKDNFYKHKDAYGDDSEIPLIMMCN